MTHDSPIPGSDQISKAFSDAWIGTHGYLRSDGSRQAKAIAFQGNVTTTSGDIISEVFVVDLPNDVSQPSDAGPLEGTTTTRPRPPAGVVQRRLTFTQQRKFPGIQGERHWLRSHPDGSQIAFLMKDDRGLVQLWTVSPIGGEPKPLTANDHDIASAFSWSPDGTQIAHVMDGSVCVTDSQTGITRRLTAKLADAKSAPRPEACVFSPDGKQIAFVRAIADAKTGDYWNQIFVVDLDEPQS
ncbi:MAG: hypothetical protein R3C28_16830 [Pirellulaceae bacterium]